ncbi:MAG: ArnT family glycosyltransferase [Woeseia sp.]
MSNTYNKQLLLLLLVAAVILAAGLGLRDPWPADEPRFALIARDMLEGGDWFLPRVGGVIYPDKPPLFFWLVAALLSITGSVRVAILLPAFVAGIAVLWLVTDLARRLWNPRVAIWTGAALLAVMQFPLQMKGGQIDGLLCLWTTLSLYGFCRHLLLGPDWRWYTIAGFSAGIGVITKGVGFLPFLIFVPYVIALKRSWPVPRITGGSRWLYAPLAFLAAIAIWLIPLLLATTGTAPAELVQYRDDILLRQTVSRYADSWVHIKPAWYLFTNAIPWLWMPLSFLLPWLIPAWKRDLKLRDPNTLLLGGWIVLVLLFFSLSDGKRSVYIFPALPALALIAGPHISRIVRGRGPRRVLFAISLTLAAALVIVGIHPHLEPIISSKWLASAPVAEDVWMRIAAIGLAGLFIVAVTQIKRAAGGYAAVMATLWIGLSLLIFPRIDELRSGRAIIDAARSQLTSGDTLGFAGWKEQFLLQWDAPAVHFGYRRADVDAESHDAATWLSLGLNRRLLLPGGMIEPCFDRARLTDLGAAHKQDWYLADHSSVLPGCRDGEAIINSIVYYRATTPLALSALSFRGSKYLQVQVVQ